VQQYKVFAQKYYDPINDPDKQGTGMLALNPEDTDAWWAQAAIAVSVCCLPTRDRGCGEQWSN
jgi:hypothetical protein